MPEPDRDDIPVGTTFRLAFPVTLEAVVQAEEGGGFSAEVPALPGCITEADTLEELRVNLADAAAGWVQTMNDLAAERDRVPAAPLSPVGS